MGNPYGFTGHRFSAAGLYETPFRAYSPTLCRWLQREPLRHIAGLTPAPWTEREPPLNRREVV